METVIFFLFVPEQHERALFGCGHRKIPWDIDPGLAMAVSAQLVRFVGTRTESRKEAVESGRTYPETYPDYHLVISHRAKMAHLSSMMCL